MRSRKPKRVLFVCIGNCCRSQMAEGFARHYGSDVLIPESAGTFPAGVVVRETVRTMAEKNIDISAQYSKPLRTEETGGYDLIVNLSGADLPSGINVPVRVWDVRDPIGQSDSIYREVRDQIETLVMQIILELRPSRQPRNSP